MATLRVFYFGLISHVSDSGDHAKEYAAIVRNNHHIPLFITQTDPHLPYPDVVRSISPAVRKITCGTEKSAAIDQLFVRYVPPLKKILGGQLAANIKEKIVEVKYPVAGNDVSVLSVAQLYKERALYENTATGATHAMCVSRITVATLTTSAPGVTFKALNAGGQELWTEHVTLESDKCVLLANVATTLLESAAARFLRPALAVRGGAHHDEEERAHDAVPDHDANPASAHSHPGGHAAIFGEILDGDAADDLKVTEIDDCSEPLAYSPCTWLARLFQLPGMPMSGDNVECGTTGWP